ncbi:MAG: hypothetical protein IT430_10180 [Phycisphaerales bacterium]|nr:hypothetical protein [Phycisphaerales bacterium]
MRIRDLISILLVVVVLLAMAWLDNSNHLYYPGGRGMVSVSSCFGYVAGGLIIIAAMCTVLGVGPGGIPKLTLHCVFGSILGVVVVGVSSGWLSSWQYMAKNPGEQIYIDWFSDVAGLLTFCLIFGGTLYLPYLSRSQVGETRCRKCNHVLRGLKEPRCPECGEAI